MEIFLLLSTKIAFYRNSTFLLLNNLYLALLLQILKFIRIVAFVEVDPFKFLRLSPFDRTVFYSQSKVYLIFVK